MGINVHQALHGYSEGHRQFACSAELTPNDARQLLVMSDASGAGVTAEGISYLTGYPLQESGLYALARTWPAPEMPRPGCVWTHTLFIEFTDLAVLDNPSRLEQLFRVPSAETSGTYSTSLSLSALTPAEYSLQPNAIVLFQQIATALYAHPREQVWAKRVHHRFVDDVVLRLWDLQWPRLRRSFRFCTLTTRDRSQDGSLFDLQLCAESVSRLRFSQQADGVEADETSTEPWLAQLVEHADRPAEKGFREVLRRLGTDVLGGREAMRPICNLQAVLAKCEPSATAEAIAMVQTSPLLSSSMIAREMVVSSILAHSDSLSSYALEYLLDNLKLLGEQELAQHASRLTNYLWSTSPSLLVELLFDERPVMRFAMREAAQGISIAELIARLEPEQEWLWSLLQVRPDLTESPDFWRKVQPHTLDIEHAGIALQGVAILEAAILGLHIESSIISVVRGYGTLVVLETLQKLLNASLEIPSAHIWVKHACRDVEEVSRFLTYSKSRSAQLLCCISNEIAPDLIPNGYGVDPWYTALQELHAQEALPLELLVYGFKRALGYRTRSVGALLRLTFDELHDFAKEDALNDLRWQQLRDSLPWVRSADAWDTALRLRLAVAKRSIQSLVSAEDFVAITRDDQVFLSVVEATWGYWGGERYLKEVAGELQGASDPQSIMRSRLLQDWVDSRPRWWE